MGLTRTRLQNGETALYDLDADAAKVSLPKGPVSDLPDHGIGIIINSEKQVVGIFQNVRPYNFTDPETETMMRQDAILPTEAGRFLSTAGMELPFSVVEALRSIVSSKLIHNTGGANERLR